MNGEHPINTNPMVTCDCAYCGAVNRYHANYIDYIYHKCQSCKRMFWIRPRRKDMEQKIGDKPNNKHLLTREDIKEIIDLALDIRDFEMVKEYKEMLDKMEDGEVLAFDV